MIPKVLVIKAIPTNTSIIPLNISTNPTNFLADEIIETAESTKIETTKNGIASPRE